LRQHRLKAASRTAWAQVILAKLLAEFLVSMNNASATFHRLFGWVARFRLLIASKASNVPLVELLVVFVSHTDASISSWGEQCLLTSIVTVLAAADGSFSFDLTTPSSPFTGNATVTMTLAAAGSVVGTATTASDGTFTLSFTIPSNTQGGPSNVSASDGTVSASATLVIQVPLIITPTTGSSGTSITVQSPNFSGNGNDFRCFAYQPYIAWYDPTTGTSLTLSRACPQGPLNETVTAPANLVSGRTYEIELIVEGYVIGQAPCTAQ